MADGRDFATQLDGWGAEVGKFIVGIFATIVLAGCDGGFKAMSLEGSGINRSFSTPTPTPSPTPNGPVNLIDYMTPLQKTDFLAELATVDISSAFVAAIATGKPIFVPKGYGLMTMGIPMVSGTKIVGEGMNVARLKFQNTNAMSFTPSQFNDGYLELTDMSLEYYLRNDTNGAVGLDLTRVNYSNFKNLKIKNFQIASYFRRGPTTDPLGIGANDGCYFNILTNVQSYNSAYGVYMTDMADGNSPNQNTFYDFHYENTIWTSTTAFVVIGFGHTFYSPYAGGGVGFTGSGSRFMEFRAQFYPGNNHVGDILVMGAYIESSPYYGFSLPPPSNSDGGIRIIGSHFDGTSDAEYFDPTNQMSHE